MFEGRLKALAAHLRTLDDTEFWAPEGFHQGTWQHGCGTPACVAGHTVALFEGVDAQGRIAALKERGGAIRNRARYALDLELEQAEALFQSEPFGRGVHVGARDAAAAVEHLAETGKVRWRKAER